MIRGNIVTIHKIMKFMSIKTPNNETNWALLLLVLVLE